VFKVAAFRFEASTKRTSPLLIDSRVNHWLVKFVSCRNESTIHSRSSYNSDKDRTAKVIFEQIVCDVNRPTIS